MNLGKGLAEAFFIPDIFVMVASLLPEAWTILGQDLQSAQPLGPLPKIRCL
jgi:hypothetical protein